MFKMIKTDARTYGIVINNEVVFTGSKIAAGNFAIDHCNADAFALTDVIAAFEKDGKNHADFGINGGWTFIDYRDVSEWLITIPARGVA